MKPAFEWLEGDSLLPEQKLWAAVLHRALLDACGSVGKSDTDTSKQINQITDDAMKWFKHKHKGFQTVCDLIGLDPDEVRRLALTQIRESEGKGVVHRTRGRRRAHLRG